MLGELQSLHRRISDLEDVEIEVMERLEEAQQAVERYTADLAALETEIATVEAAYEKTSGRTCRPSSLPCRTSGGTTASGLPEDLITLYEKLRAQKGGVGAAALRRRECGGCRLTLNASDLGIIAKTAQRRGGALRGVQPDPGADGGVRPVTGEHRPRRDRGRRRLSGQPRPGGVRRPARRTPRPVR